MKNYYKSEIAEKAGVSLRTFQRWMSAHRQELVAMGFKVRGKFIHPRALEWMCQEYCIDIE